MHQWPLRPALIEGVCMILTWQLPSKAMRQGLVSMQGEVCPPGRKGRLLESTRITLMAGAKAARLRYYLTWQTRDITMWWLRPRMQPHCCKTMSKLMTSYLTTLFSATSTMSTGTTLMFKFSSPPTLAASLYRPTQTPSQPNGLISR